LAVATCAHFGGLLPVVTAVETCDGAEPVNPQLGTSAVQRSPAVESKVAASELEKTDIKIQVIDVNADGKFGKPGFFFSIHDPGSDLHGSTLKQCRDKQIWEGKIILREFAWWDGQAGSHTGWKECGGAEGDWAIGDILTTADHCPPPPPPPVDITDVNKAGHLGPAGFMFSFFREEGRELDFKCVEVIRNGEPVFETMLTIQKMVRWTGQYGDTTGRRERGGKEGDWAIGDKLVEIECTGEHHWMYLTR